MQLEITTEGEKNIEDIIARDWVIADDPTTPGEIEAKQVLETFVRETDGLVDLYVDGEVISTTNEHPFWVPDKGWVEAKDLQVGSLLQTEDGRVIDVDKVEKREGKFEVYNFKVEGFHTYFVSELGFLVHNATYDDEEDIWAELDKRNNPSPISPQAQAISQGHAFTDHINQFDFDTPDEFAQHIDNIINNPSDYKDLPRDRRAYWDDTSGTVVIVDPDHIDGGTAFRPDRGRDYFDDL